MSLGGYGKLLVRGADRSQKTRAKHRARRRFQNPSALNLYRSFGFAPTFEVEYWRVSVHDWHLHSRVNENAGGV